MSRCAVCFKDIILPKFKTIGNQKVCSLSCVGLLHANKKDICGYCKRPVWKDNYYKINNKYYCSEICKNEIINELKIPKDSKLIQFFQENIFNNDISYYLKNSKQLRKEVLRFYKDFQFDLILINDEDNYSRKINSSSYKKRKINEKYYFTDYNNKNKKIYKEKLRNNSNLRNNTISEESQENSQINNNMNKTISCNYRSELRKAFAFSNRQNKEEEREINNRYKRIDKQKIVLRKYNGNNYIKDNKNKNEKDFIFSDNNLQKAIYNFKNSNPIINTKSYSFINFSRNRNNNTNEYINHNTDKSSNNENNKGNSYLTLNKNIKSLIKINSKSRYCKYCGHILGNISFSDRKGNHFCSDKCKEKFLKQGSLI